MITFIMGLVAGIFGTAYLYGLLEKEPVDKDNKDD